MTLVVIESPFAGDVALNTRYARAALEDSLDRGEAPIASHLLHTQVLDDTVPADRAVGIAAGLAWHRVAGAVVFYTDLGVSLGMRDALESAHKHGCLVEYRTVDGWAQEAA